MTHRPKHLNVVMLLNYVRDRFITSNTFYIKNKDNIFIYQILEYEMMASYNNKDIARKQPHRVIFDPLVHQRVNYQIFHFTRHFFWTGYLFNVVIFSIFTSFFFILLVYFSGTVHIYKHYCICARIGLVFVPCPWPDVNWQPKIKKQV